MDLIIFGSLLFGLQTFYWLVGRRASRNLSGKADYFLAGKNVTFFPLAMTFLATQVGGGFILGSAEEAYNFGWYVFLYPFGAAMGMIILGLGIGRRLAEFPVSTTAQVLEIVYRSPMLKKIASALSVVSLFLILVAQIVASHKFLLTLGLNSLFLFTLFWGIVILYTVKGGLKAVISTDLVQATFFSLVFLFTLGFVVYFNPIPSFELPHAETFSLVSSKLCGWLLMPLLFMVIEQDMGQRCFAGKSPRIVSKASLAAGIVTMIICFIPVFFGILAKKMGIVIPQGSSVLMTFIVHMTNPWIAAMVGCAILAAIISTATSLINAISSNISNDFDIKILNRSVRPVQIITALFSMGAFIAAFSFKNIVDLLIQSYELSVSCLFVPIFIALYKKQGNFLSALLSMLFGAIGFVAFKFIPTPIPKEILSIVLSFSGYGFGEGFEWIKRRNKERLLS